MVVREPDFILMRLGSNFYLEIKFMRLKVTVVRVHNSVPLQYITIRIVVRFDSSIQDCWYYMVFINGKWTPTNLEHCVFQLTTEGSPLGDRHTVSVVNFTTV